MRCEMLLATASAAHFQGGFERARLPESPKSPNLCGAGATRNQKCGRLRTKHHGKSDRSDQRRIVLWSIQFGPERKAPHKRGRPHTVGNASARHSDCPDFHAE